MPFAPKMNAFQTEIGGNQCLVILRDCEHRRVVADSGHDVATLNSILTNASYQCFFSQRHASVTIDEMLCRNGLVSGQPHSSADSSIECLHGRHACAYVANLRARPIR